MQRGSCYAKNTLCGERKMRTSAGVTPAPSVKMRAEFILSTRRTLLETSKGVRSAGGVRDARARSVRDARNRTAWTARAVRCPVEGLSCNLNPHLALRRLSLFLHADVYVAAESSQEFTEPLDREFFQA